MSTPTPGISGLNVQFGSALSIVKNVFSDLQTLAQFLPGGATSEFRRRAFRRFSLIVSDTCTIADMPLGLGNLANISLDIGLSVEIQPLSVNFTVGIGAPDNPFNWIATPLRRQWAHDAGRSKQCALFTIQAGIGLGLAIDLGIASGSASVTLAFQLNVDGNSITLMVILTGQASVDVFAALPAPRSRFPRRSACR